MIRRTLLEWQSLPHGPGEGEIDPGLADRLASVARASPLGGPGGGRILAHGRHALGARGMVGVIAADGCALEILPKIDGLGDGADAASRGRIRERLIHMLAVAHDLPLDIGRITPLGWQSETLLEILIGLFARQLAEAVRRGLPRLYVGQEEDLPALRGRLDATRQFTTLAASPERLACRYDALSRDIALNRIIKAAVVKLARLSRSAANQRLLRDLAFAYADVADVPASALRFDTVVPDRSNARWRGVLGLARLLLGDRFQTTSAGALPGHALLFEMATLFEDYVARTLARALAPDGLGVVRQGGRKFCLTELDEEDGEGAGRFQTIPDILVKRGEETLMVIDTKWKRLSPRIDDPKQGVAQADVYQMIAYGRLYGCRELMLLYPWHGGLGEGHAPRRYAVSGSEDRLSIATIDIAEGGELAGRLARLVRDRIGERTGLDPAARPGSRYARRDSRC